MKLLLDAYEVAEGQSALTWQLKCANSIAKYGNRQSFDTDRKRIERTLGRFPGAPIHADLQVAEARMSLRFDTADAT
jgi:hypothetical protein